MTPEKRASSESQNESAEMTFYHTPKFHSQTPGLVPHDCRGENLLGGGGHSLVILMNKEDLSFGTLVFTFSAL